MGRHWRQLCDIIFVPAQLSNCLYVNFGPQPQVGHSGEKIYDFHFDVANTRSAC